MSQNKKNTTFCIYLDDTVSDLRLITVLALNGGPR